MSRFTRGFLTRASLPTLPAAALGVCAFVVNDGTNTGMWVWDGSDWQLLIVSADGLTVGGDLTGDLPNPTIAKLMGRDIDTTPPTDGQTLRWSQAANKWVPGA